MSVEHPDSGLVDSPSPVETANPSPETANPSPEAAPAAPEAVSVPEPVLPTETAPETVSEAPETVSEAPTASPDSDVDVSDEGWADLIPEAEQSEIERLLETPYGPFALADGTQVKVTPLRLREFLSLLRIITNGSGPALSSIQLDTNDPTAFAQQLLASLIFAIPEAEVEVVQFLQMVTVPANSTKSEDRISLAEKLDNPDLNDAINIIAVVARSEATDLVALGKRLRAMFKTAQKMGLTGDRGKKN